MLAVQLPIRIWNHEAPSTPTQEAHAAQTGEIGAGAEEEAFPKLPTTNKPVLKFRKEPDCQTPSRQHTLQTLFVYSNEWK